MAAAIQPGTTALILLVRRVTRTKSFRALGAECWTVMRASPDQRGGFAGSLKRYARDRIDFFLKPPGQAPPDCSRSLQ